MSVPEPTGDASAELRALQREIEQVHAEVHELAEQVADLQRAWAALPRWLRWWARPAPHP
jgi:prefoldin subunit 5